MAATARADSLPRIWRSPWSDFNGHGDELHDDTVTVNRAYTDDYLAEIKAHGFDAVWVRGQLERLVRSSVFPEFGAQSLVHLDGLYYLVNRCAKHGIRVFVYMQAPLGFDEADPFWSAHPEARGAPMPWRKPGGAYTTYNAMCTSTDEVRAYLTESSSRLFEEIPNLGGLILITASEHPSHCYRSAPDLRYIAQRRHLEAAAVGLVPLQCDRCDRRNPADVIAEIIQRVHVGARQSSKDALVIAWNWSWLGYQRYHGDPPAEDERLLLEFTEEIISRLPEDVVVMPDFERGDTKPILGGVRSIDEYALSVAGPSRVFKHCRQIATRLGKRTMACVQIGTTMELGTVPNLPVIGTIREKAQAMRELGIEGYMGCWNMGNMLSANSAAFNYFLDAANDQDRQGALQAFAREYFAGCDSARVVRAWELFAEAMDSYPYSIPFLYHGPVNYAIAYPLCPGPLKGGSLGLSWEEEPRGDDLAESLTPFSLDEVITGLETLVSLWEKASQVMETGLASSDAPVARDEITNAWVTYHAFRSTRNVYRVYALRKNWSDEKLPIYRQNVIDELENIQAALSWIGSDHRYGWYPESQTYMFGPASIATKVAELNRQLATDLAE